MTRVERITLARQRVVAARIAADLRARFPDLSVGQTADGVVVAGRGLGRRMLHDVRLRDLRPVGREESG